MISKIPEAIGNIVSVVGPKIMEVLAVIGSSIMDAAPSVLTWAGDMIGKVPEAIGNVVSTIGDKMFEIMGIIGAKIIETGPSVLSWAGDMIGKVPEAIGNAVSSVTTKIGEIVGEIMGGFGPTTVSDMLTKAGEVIAKVPEAIGNALTDVQTKIGEIVSGIVDPITGIDLFAAGAAILQSLWNGIQSMAQTVIDGFGGFVGTLRGLLPFSPAKWGPFSGHGYPLYSGMAIMDSLAEGIEMASSSAIRTTKNAVMGVYDAMSGDVSITSTTTQDSNMLAVLAQIRDNMNMGIYLDGRTLVGGIAPTMNAALGVM